MQLHLQLDRPLDAAHSLQHHRHHHHYHHQRAKPSSRRLAPIKCLQPLQLPITESKCCISICRTFELSDTQTTNKQTNSISQRANERPLASKLAGLIAHEHWRVLAQSMDTLERDGHTPIPTGGRASWPIPADRLRVPKHGDLAEGARERVPVDERTITVVQCNDSHGDDKPLPF